MHGWHGRILHVDLNRQTHHSEPLADARLLDQLGGRALAVSLFEPFANLEPSDPQLPLVLAVGPLAGTGTAATERLCMLGRSPLTGTLFDISSGGSFAHAFKASGYDALVISGVAARPYSLHITPSGVRFEPADKLWGASTSKTIASFEEPGVAAIGPGGETGVLYANPVFSDGDNDGRGGLGAVMGGKRLKAIAIAGDRMTSVADPERLHHAQQDILRLLRASPAVMGPLGLHCFGTATFIDLVNQRHMLPTRNFTATSFAQIAQVNAPALRAALQPAHSTCHDCPIACKLASRRYGRLPEFSALGHLTALLDNADLLAAVAGNTACRELGLDPVSAAATLATLAEIDGTTCEPAQLPQQLEQICRRADTLPLPAQGARRLADVLGRPDTAMTVHSLELPAFDPRGAYGIALSYCTSGLGGSHRRAHMEATEILRKPVATDRFSLSGKARQVKLAEDLHAAADSLIVCPNALYAASLEEYADATAAVTGCEFTAADLSRRGETVVQRERAINRAYGFAIGDAQLPERFFTTPGSSGDGVELPPLDQAAFRDALQRYERIRGDAAAEERA